MMLTPEEEWAEREFELLEEIKHLKGQITYLQEELSSAYDELDECRDVIAGYDEGMM
jgi:uncharacterized coiled-coil DUF342 family protein